MLKTFINRMKGGQTLPPKKPFSKIAWSWIGAFLGIYFVSILNQLFISDTSIHLFIVGSFGASAVLIYGAPQTEFSQPRNLIGGHFISAIIGVTIYKFLNLDINILGALAVSISVIAMHFTRTLHPPGGATALISVMGSTEVHSLGYTFVFFPILSGTLILLIIALLVNNLSTSNQRHYPRWWL